MTPEDLKARTKAFALRIIKLCEALPKTGAARRIGGQLLRSGTSVGSNYRSACRARSTREFVSKIGIVEEEADESAFWIELLADAKIVRAASLGPLLTAANALCAIATSSGRTAARRAKRTQKSSLTRGCESAIRNPKSEI